MARSELVLCGLRLAAAAFSEVDSRIRFAAALREGSAASPDAPLAFVSGPARGILAAERTAADPILNLESRQEIGRAQAVVEQLPVDHVLQG